MNCTRTIRPWTWSVSGPRNVLSHSCDRTPVAVAARWFQDNFKGDVFYAVKANPSPWVIETLAANGVTVVRRRLDPRDRAGGRARARRAHGLHASGQEPRARSPRPISTTACSTFALDTHEELAKILEATGGAKDLNLIVRLAVSAEGAAYPLSGKFGVDAARGRRRCCWPRAARPRT